MESKKHSRSASAEKKVTEKAKYTTCKCSGERKKKERMIKEEQGKEKCNRTSMIPVLKSEKIDLKSLTVEQKRPSEPPKSPCACPCAKKPKKDDDLELKIKILEEKEKSIAEYYIKIEDMLRKMIFQKDGQENNEPDDDKTCQNTFARKMTSDPEVFRNGKLQNKLLSDFENNVEEISSIWLQTSADLFRALKKTLKKNPSLDPLEFEVENERIQVAIKQAKSLTLLKTRNVIAEAKKLYHHGEIIRTQLEKLLSTENIRSENGNRAVSQGECQQGLGSSDKKEADGTGDSTNQTDLEKSKMTCIEETQKEESEPVREYSQSLEKGSNSGVLSEKQAELNQSSCTSFEILAEEVGTLAAELAKKNETITSLNNRIFELQKACNEHIYKYNQLQATLSEFQEKIQWNQVLWKQIRKLKEQITELQQSNKQLEAHKKELENKIMKMDKELERLIKLNRLLNQRKYLLEAHVCSGKNCRIRQNAIKEVEEKYSKNLEFSVEAEERILADKQNAINQLKSVLGAMRDQEDFAQMQIALFQSKIEALEKKS